MPPNPRRRTASAARSAAHASPRGSSPRGSSTRSFPASGSSSRTSSSRTSTSRTSTSRTSSGRNRAPSASSTREADRQLEAWFAEAAAGAPVTETSFGKLGLPQALVTALERREIRTTMPIQAATLPAALEGRDVIGRAQTGSGKTLAFGLPMIARLSGSTSRPTAPRGLVLVPTRELAVQVREALEPLGHAMGVKTVAVFGGAPIGRQIQTLARGVDIIVATPGRLLDLIERRSCTLADIEITVLDEADHMADMGFLPDVTRLLDMTPRGTQRMLFSATLDGAVGRVVHDYLDNPVARAVASADALIDTMEHRALVVRSEDKVNVLAEIAQRPARTLMFVRTKHGADRLVKQLGRLGIDALAIHGNRTQAARQKALDTFARGQVRLLVATDVAARGIHIADVDLVVHVDPPNDHKDYLHRSGRTARAGASGVVVSMLTRDQVRDARTMFSRAGVDIDTIEAATGSDVVRALAESGEAIVIAPAPAGRSTSSSDGRYDGDRGPRRGPPRRPNGNRNGNGGSRPYGRRAA